jgi:2-hydroxy-6-oxonona-2,4-dienedioate hydrolase
VRSEAIHPFAAEVDSRSRRLRTPFDGGEMMWRLWGSGPAIMLLHGGHGSWTHWIRNVAELAKDHTVLAPDMPGYGESDAPAEPYTPMSLAASIAHGLDAVLGPATALSIIGFSFGATVGGYVASLRRGSIRQLVLVGAGGLALPSPEREALRNWRLAKSDGAREAAHRSNLAALMIADPARIDDLAVYVQNANTRRTRINSRQFGPQNLLAKVLTSLHIPLAGIWGSRDATALGYISAREAFLRELDPAAPFVQVEGAGHWVQYEDPIAFNQALAGALARID